jgi:hypothetical protein
MRWRHKEHRSASLEGRLSGDLDDLAHAHGDHATVAERLGEARCDLASNYAETDLADVVPDLSHGPRGNHEEIRDLFQLPQSAYGHTHLTRSQVIVQISIAPASSQNEHSQLSVALDRRAQGSSRLSRGIHTDDTAGLPTSTGISGAITAAAVVIVGEPRRPAPGLASAPLAVQQPSARILSAKSWSIENWSS